MKYRLNMSVFLILVFSLPINANDSARVWQNFGEYIDRDTSTNYRNNRQSIDSSNIDSKTARPNSNEMREDFEFTLDYVGSAGWGYCKDVQVRDDIAYCTYGAGLVILDVSDPNNPQFISKCYTKYSPEQLILYGDYAYVATGGKALDIIDISDINNPVEVGYYGNYGAWKVALDTSGIPLIAVILGGAGAQFVEVWDHNTFVLIADPFVVDPHDMIFDDEVGYMVDWSGENLQIWDVSDYTNIYTYSILPLASRPNSLIKKGNMIYIAAQDGSGPEKITAVDVSDVNNPSITAVYDSMDYYYNPEDIDIVGDTLIVSMGTWEEILLFDISNPLEINRFASVMVGVDAFGIDVYNNNLYVACSYSGVNILDISNPQYPYYISNYINEAGGNCKAGATYNIELSDTLAYVFNCGALTPINISDPANPFAISCDDNVKGGRFDLQGDNAFSVNSMGTGGSRGIDISDPYNLITLSYLHYSATSWDIDAEGDYAYVAADTSGLQITDISDPSNLFITGYYNEIYTDGSKVAGTVTIRDSIAFVGDSRGMRAIDISDPANPVKVGDYEVWTEQGVRRIVLRDSLAFLVLQPSDTLSLAVVNISDPTNMTTAGIFIHPDFYSLYDDAFDIALSGNYAFVANGGVRYYGLIMLDISDLSEIRVVGMYDTPRDAVIGVESRGRYVYLTDYYGMIILHVDYPAPCGDINADDLINVFDVTYLINYLYKGGEEPNYPDAVDVNNDGNINIFDIVYLITYLYRGGPALACP